MYVNSRNQLREHLSASGNSKTASRQAIFDVLLNSEPLYMHEIVSKLKGRVDRASIYRTIDLFEKLHITDRLTIGWKYKVELSDAFNDHHHHIICTVCHKIQDLHENPELEDTVDRLGKKHGFTITNHQIELRGICADCNKP